MMNVDVELSKCRVTFEEGTEYRKENVRVIPHNHSIIRQITVRLQTDGSVVVAAWNKAGEETILMDLKHDKKGRV
jgi:mRNA degradation ribonuclease J1/J2